MTALQELLDSIATTGTSDIPDRIVRLNLQCQGTVGDEDDWEYSAPCPFDEDVDVAVFDDTREALWFCSNDHENSVSYERVAP